MTKGRSLSCPVRVETKDEKRQGQGGRDKAKPGYKPQGGNKPQNGPKPANNGAKPNNLLKMPPSPSSSNGHAILTATGLRKCCADRAVVDGVSIGSRPVKSSAC